MKPSKQKTKCLRQSSEPDIEVVAIDSIRPAYQNDSIYKPVRADDPEIVALAKNIKTNGLLEPIAVTTDNVVVSGHRRRMACIVAGLKLVPVRRLKFSSTDPRFPEMLVDYNQQRVKSPEECIREEITRTSPESSMALLSQRRKTNLAKLYSQAEDVGLAEIDYAAPPSRDEISDGKQAMLEAAEKVIEDNREWWPLSLRQVHYRLLNDPPIRNTRSRKGLRYVNDQASYKDLSDLLVRARLAGLIPWEAICDETRPVSLWRNWLSVSQYVADDLENLFSNYRRNLLQSQPSHTELIVEKMTVQSIADRAAGRFGVTVTVGRGFSSITAKHDLVSRFLRSGKNTLTLLVVSDFDPEGECISENLVASIRHEFGIHNVLARKIALTMDQVETLELPSGGKAKKTSSRYESFVSKWGDDVYELEALEPAQLEKLIVDAIVAVTDADLIRYEQERESEEARELEARRRIALAAMGGAA